MNYWNTEYTNIVLRIFWGKITILISESQNNSEFTKLEDHIFKLTILNIGNGWQVTVMQRHYYTFVIGIKKWLLLIPYPFFLVTASLQLLVTDVLNVINALLVTAKSN
jgi:hypothetical protein